MSKIRIAQIGTSMYSHGNLIWNTLGKQADVFEVVGYALPENEREKFPENMAAFADFRELTVQQILSDPTIEAVAIETEEIYLFKYAIMAAKAGKHIHMEKPGGIESVDFQELIRIVKEKNLVLHLGYMYRYNPCVRELISQVKAGTLGEIISVEAQMNGIYPPTVQARQWLSAFQGGIMFFLGCHLLDLILQIQGMPETVIPFNCSTGDEVGGAEDFAMAVLKYPNGASFAKVNAAEVAGYNRRQLVVSGTKGTAEFKPFEISVGNNMVYTEKTAYIDNGSEITETRETSEKFDRYGGMLSAFASYVRGTVKNPYTPDYELALYTIIQKACGREV